MEVLKIAEKAFGHADKRLNRLIAEVESPEFGKDFGRASMVSFEATMLGTTWKLSADIVRDLSEPLKSIVNK